MNEKQKTQPQKRHYAQQRELASLLFRFPKHRFLPLYSNGCQNENEIKLFRKIEYVCSIEYISFCCISIETFKTSLKI